ncbi:MAG TPA: DsbA family protein [Alphaproteobacteria bacterium]|nr:DsbA family protein [Alphaproteobacteria bacterium]
MADPIIFYAEFVSPNTYLAIRDLNRVAQKHGREIEWRAFSLMQVWDAIDYHPLGKPREKARYIRRDFQRCAVIEGQDLTMPEKFPLDAEGARLGFWRLAARDRAAANAFAAEVFNAYWGRGETITEPDVLAACAEAAGADPAEIAAAADDEDARKAMVEAGEQAVADGVFGSPHIIVSGEPFWGHDRVEHIDWWLQHGV